MEIKEDKGKAMQTGITREAEEYFWKKYMESLGGNVLIDRFTEPTYPHRSWFKRLVDCILRPKPPIEEVALVSDVEFRRAIKEQILD